MERQWLHMWNPRLTKITSLRSRFTMLQSVVCHMANRLKSWRTPSPFSSPFHACHAGMSGKAACTSRADVKRLNLEFVHIEKNPSWSISWFYLSFDHGKRSFDSFIWRIWWVIKATSLKKKKHVYMVEELRVSLGKVRGTKFSLLFAVFVSAP